MAISRYPAKVTMPRIDPPYPTVLDFLSSRFPGIGRDVWQERIARGLVFDDGGRPVTGEGEYAPQKRIFYHREVAEEPSIPFAERVLFTSDDIVVACKPHFLPVTPAGPYLEECLLYRLRRATGNDDLVPVHRIDRETAGLVLFSANKRTRPLYNALFKNGEVEKRYEALSAGKGDGRTGWLVENRMVPGEPWFRMTCAAGSVNARSRIELVAERGGVSRFLLSPLTGKTHQLRFHMAGIGYKILNDRLYPELEPERADDFGRPLQLVARELKFKDPVTGRRLEFRSERELLW